MTTQHTSGPWIADDNEGFGVWRIWSKMTPTGSGKPGPVVANVIGDSAETDANARLIAAAPDLLAELQNIANADPRKWDEETRDQFQQWAQSRARAAIAKATGGEYIKNIFKDQL